jgi:hypothetical protein
MRALLLALERGDDFRIARTLAGEAGLTTGLGVRAEPRGAKLLARARRLAEASGDPLAIASVLTSEGVAAVCAGKWAPGLDALQRAQPMLREQCVGAHWEINLARLFELYALYSLGRMQELAQVGRECAREAEQRGNILGQAIGSFSIVLGSLCEGAVEEAKQQTQLAIDLWSRWSPPGVQMPHLWHLIARANTAAYAGLPAWAELEPRCRELEQSLMSHFEMMRVFMLDLHGRVALSDAVLTGRMIGASVEEARRTARQLRRQQAPWAQALGVLLDAQLLHVAGQKEAAVSSLADAARRFDAADMAMHAAVARIRQGQLIGGEEGAHLRSVGGVWMARERIAEPDRWLS